VEAFHIVERGRVEVGERADHRPAIGVVGREHGGGENREEMAIGLVVVALALLVLDHLLLLLEHGGRHGVDEIAELVGFGPDHLLQRIVGNGLQVDGLVVVGEAIGAGAANAGGELVQPARAEVL
jgi:hypothetical protein